MERKPRLLGALAGSIAFVIGGLFLYFDPGQEITARIVGASGCLTFGLFGIVAIKRLATKPRFIHLDEQGITTDAVPGAAEVHIRWANIRGAYIWGSFGQSCVAIDTIAIQDIYATVSAPGQAVLKANQWLTGSPVLFSGPVFGLPNEGLYQELEVRARAFHGAL